MNVEIGESVGAWLSWGQLIENEEALVSVLSSQEFVILVHSLDMLVVTVAVVVMVVIMTMMMGYSTESSLT